MSSARPTTADDTGADALLLFDAGCPFCRRSLRWLLARERADSRLRLSALDGRLSRRLGGHFGIDFAGSDSIWLFADGEMARNSSAAWRLATRLHGPWRWLSGVRWIPRSWRDGAYRFIGNRRGRLAFLDADRLEGHPRWLDRLTPGLCTQLGLPMTLADAEEFDAS
ncbi:thiol-disulfide oxidoreductase DCC family protein [Salinicola avicenniae]|uniref:thiol-disulfide oxidoreductase DCC family protein n=1 Tax=Salinicola avicenniae TaxID=2916836 RepID=UPI0020739866|nr:MULTISPECIES: DCC1-like thiol-disulfide oxidoreductase family protein [unclassified Salinicola]